VFTLWKELPEEEKKVYQDAYLAERTAYLQTD
jgi:hypothetical protein